MDPLSLVFCSVLCSSEGWHTVTRWREKPDYGLILRTDWTFPSTAEAYNFSWAATGFLSLIKWIVFVQFSGSDVQIGQRWVVSEGRGMQGLTCSRLKVRVCCSPLKVSRHMIDTSFLLSCSGVNKPPNICSQAALMESYWHQTLARTSPPNSLAGARWQPTPLLLPPPPGQITRRNGLQVPPQARLCRSTLTTLWWLPMFSPVKRQIVQQTALLWIHPAVRFSKEVKENPWPELLNFETELFSEKVERTQQRGGPDMGPASSFCSTKMDAGSSLPSLCEVLELSMMSPAVIINTSTCEDEREKP